MDDTAEGADLPTRVARIVLGGGWEHAVQFIESQWDAYATADPQQLRSAIVALPSEALLAHPSLVTGAGYLAQVAKGGNARTFHSSFSAGARTVRGQLVSLTEQAAHDRTTGNMAEAVSAVVRAQEILAGAKKSELVELRPALPHLILQWGRVLQLNRSGGAAEYNEAYDIAVHTSQPQIARRAACNLAWLHASEGRTSLSTQWIDNARSHGEISTRYDAPLVLARALVSIDRLDIGAARHALRELSSLDLGEHEISSFWVRALCVRTAGEAVILDDSVSAALERLPRGVASGRLNSLALRSTRLLLRRAQGLNPRRLPHKSPDGDTIADLVSAVEAYRLGHYSHAIALAQPATLPEYPPRVRVQALVVSAAALLERGEHAAAESMFTKAYALIEYKHLYAALLTLEPAHITRLYELTGNVPTTPIRGLVEAHSPLESVDRGGMEVLTTLTRREREALALLTSGRKMTAIAASMHISPNTLKTTTRGLYRKIGAKNREDAAQFARTVGVTAPER